MYPPILLLISTNPHTGPLLEQALDHRRATTILPATTTEEGLRILKDQADLALVLCDENGGQIASQVVLSQARRTAHNLPVIILGTDGSAKAAVEALHRGATDYLAQPVTAKDLRTAIHKTHVFDAPEALARTDQPSAFDQVVSRSPQMELLGRPVPRLADRVPVAPRLELPAVAPLARLTRIRIYACEPARWRWEGGQASWLWSTSIEPIRFRSPYPHCTACGGQVAWLGPPRRRHGVWYYDVRCDCNDEETFIWSPFPLQMGGERSWWEETHGVTFRGRD